MFMSRQALAVDHLERLGLSVPAGPIVRCMLEHAVMMRWLLTSDDEETIAALDRIGRRERHLLHNDARRVDPDWPLAFPAPEGEKPALFDQARIREQMFEAVDVPYALYRDLSRASHPGDYTMAVHLKSIGEGRIEIAVEPHSDVSLVEPAALYLLWGGHVLGTLGHPTPEFDAWLDRASERFAGAFPPLPASYVPKRDGGPPGAE